MRHSHSDTDKKQLIGVATLAAAAAAVTALLFTKKNGAETRQAIKEQAEKIKLGHKDQVADSTKTVKKTAVVAKTKATRAKNQAVAKTSAKLPAKSK